MKAVPSDIEGHYNFTVQFRIENVREYIERNDSQNEPERQTSQKFGPGWYFEWYMVIKDDKASLGLYLQTSSGYPEPITWSVVAKSLHGDEQYFDHTTTHTFTAAKKGLGWSTFISEYHLERHATLREENTLRITATIRARMARTYHDLANCLDVLHGLVTSGKRPCDISFVANSDRSRSGQFSSPRKLFADKEYIRKFCPPLGECRFRPTHLPRIDD